MIRLVPNPLSDTPDALMNKAGYTRHCVKSGRVCYHRRLNDVPFPRFHIYVAMKDEGMEIDLHIDAQNLEHKGNHGEAWAYEGERVESEMHRTLDIICNQVRLAKINQPANFSPRHQ
jgi:hypothetical protein